MLTRFIFDKSGFSCSLLCNFFALRTFPTELACSSVKMRKTCITCDAQIYAAFLHVRLYGKVYYVGLQI